MTFPWQAARERNGDFNYRLTNSMPRRQGNAPFHFQIENKNIFNLEMEYALEKARPALVCHVLNVSRRIHKACSLREPEVSWTAKGKKHKKYEFGAQAAIVIAKTNTLPAFPEVLPARVSPYTSLGF